MKALVMLVLVFLLAGCAAGQGGAGRTPSENTTTNGTEETTFYKEETTVLPGPEGLPRPPDTTLSSGGQEVKGTLGSYCWTSGRTGICSDTFFIVPARKKTLMVPPGSEMVFRYGGQRSPKKVGATASPISKNDTSSASPDPNRSRSLKVHGSGVERTIPVELPPGEYVVDVFITVQQGDATYYFRIMVE
jgi:hypothetical protein